MRIGERERPSSLYHTNRGETFVLDLKTGTEQRILEGIFTRDAVWSPDGKRLAYTVPPRGVYLGESTVFVSDTGGADRQPVARETSCAPNPTWASDTSLLYMRGAILPSFELKHDFWLTEFQNDIEPRRVEGDDEPKKTDAAVFTGMGKTIIAYSSLRSGFYEIWTLTVEEGQREQLTRLESYAGNPSWEPGGTNVVFDSDASGEVQIYRIGADGSGLKQLSHGPGPSRKPTWFSMAAPLERGQ